MGNAIAAVRFRGDAEGERRLREDESLRGSLGSACWKGSSRDSRRRLLAGAVRVRPDLVPGAWRAAERVRERSGDGTRVELYVHASPEINAAVTCGGDRLLVIVTSAAVERLDEEELSFVLGHELGHGVYGHLGMPIGGVPRGMSARDAMRVMAWQRATEVSADRAGLLCCGSVGAAASALFKSLSGLSLAGVAWTRTRSRSSGPNLRTRWRWASRRASGRRRTRSCRFGRGRCCTTGGATRRAR